MTSRELNGDGTVDSPRLVVFSDDWGRHPSSCQHLVRQLLPRHEVVWVNTIGTRPPRFDLLTLRRGAGKLAEWLAPNRESRPTGPGPDDPAPRVLAPAMWPRFSTSTERRLNARLLRRRLVEVADDDRPTVALTTIPLVADLVERSPVDRWIYYCVDDLAEWPGLDRDTLLRMERDLVERVDEIVVVSRALGERMEQLGRRSTLLTHGVDLEHWRRPAAEGASSGSAGSVIFWGVVDRRLEVSWVEALAARIDASVVLVGPHNNPAPRLSELAGVELAGPVDYGELPRIAADAGVLIMPYGQSPATRAMQPLKLKEYLATDRPVVVADLPAVVEWSDACDVASDADSFVGRVVERLETGLPPAQAEARRRLERESWEAKAGVLERLVLGNGRG